MVTSEYETDCTPNCLQEGANFAAVARVKTVRESIQFSGGKGALRPAPNAGLNPAFRGTGFRLLRENARIPMWAEFARMVPRMCVGADHVRLSQKSIFLAIEHGVYPKGVKRFNRGIS